MKLTVVASQSLESSTMVGRIIPLLLELKRQFGIKSEIVALHHDYKRTDKKVFEQDGLAVKYVGQMAVVKKEGGSKEYRSGVKLIATVVWSSLKIFGSLLRSKSNIIYVVKPHPQNLLPAILVKLLRRKKIVLDSDDLEVEANKTQSKLQRRVLKFTEKLGVKFSVAIITCSPFLSKHYQGLGMPANKIFYIPTGLDDISKDKILFSRAGFLQKHNLKPDTKIILYCGSLSISSGHRLDILLKSLSILVKDLEQVVLVLAGSGEDRKYLEDLAKKLKVADKIIFYGRYQSAETRSLIELANVVVDPVDDSLTNRAKSSSRVVQALYLNKPVVTSNVGVRKELLQGLGTMAKPDNPVDLARVLKLVMTDQQLADEFLVGHDRVKLMQWSQLAPKVKKVLEKVG
ncbi:MAG: glycosyltransferase [Parcubacteria group bacterium]